MFARGEGERENTCNEGMKETNVKKKTVEDKDGTGEVREGTLHILNSKRKVSFCDH